MEAEHIADFMEQFRKAKAYLDSARPTAVNLSWALKRMEKTADAFVMNYPDPENWKEFRTALLEELKREAVEIKEEDIRVCRQIGEYGLSLVKPGDGILTHCNAGQLATCKYGTATAPIYL